LTNIKPSSSGLLCTELINSQQQEGIRLENNNLRWTTMKESQLLDAILARLIPALIIMSPTAFADESFNEHQVRQSIVNANTKQWDAPPKYMHWTIPPINKQWGIPPRSRHWTIPRSANSLISPRDSNYSSEARDWEQER